MATPDAVKKKGLSILDLETGDWLYFDTYIQNDYTNENRVAYEVLEQGSFSSDSKQNTPKTINIIGTKAIATATGDQVNDLISFKQQLEQLGDSAHLVDIYLNALYGEYSNSYQNYTFTVESFEQNPEQLHLVAHMTFMQIRMTTIDYSKVTAPARPSDTTVQNNGQVQPQKQSSSVAFDLFGRVV